jgi:hypothetical protein
MTKNVKFSSNQIAAIEWLATSKFDRHPPTQGLLADQLGVSLVTISRWKRKPEFNEAVTARARELLGSDLSEIYASLRREAIAGSFQHIKLALELAGEYTERRELTGADGGAIVVEWNDGSND